MERRDFIKAAPVLVAGAVASAPEPSSCARAVWAAYCKGPEMQADVGLPSADAYCAAQRDRGRTIVARIDRAHDTTLVIVAEDAVDDLRALDRAQQIIDRFNACHTTAEADFGSVMSVAAIAKGQTVDPVALLAAANTERLRLLEARVARLQAEQRRRWPTAVDDRPHHPSPAWDGEGPDPEYADEVG